jgi:hypothetical protein
MEAVSTIVSSRPRLRPAPRNLDDSGSPLVSRFLGRLHHETVLALPRGVPKPSGPSFPRQGKTLGLLANYTADSDFPGFLTSHELAMGFALLRKCIAVHSPPPVL